MSRAEQAFKRWEQRNGHKVDVDIEIICASVVEPEEVRWLWERRIPFGKLTIFDGDPDQGKSVVTMDIAARVSTGRNFPDGTTCEAANVCIANVEDGVADTIVPRLIAHGADLDRIQIVQGMPDPQSGTRLLEIPQDIAALERLVEQHDIKLLIIDPVLTMLGGDANRDQDARKALAPLRDMAERTGCAVIGIRHLNKSVGLKAIQRGGGNMGLIGVARAGSFFAENPDADGQKVMVPHKANLSEKAPGLTYKIVTAAVHNTARIEWVGTTEHDANSLASNAQTPQEKTELDEAKEFLRDELADGPMWAKQVYKDAEDAGVARRTLHRAKSALRAKSEKVGAEGWTWSLPDGTDPKPVGDPSGKVAKGCQTETPDNVGNVGNVQAKNETPPLNMPYLWEGCQGCQGYQPDRFGDVPGNLRPVDAEAYDPRTQAALRALTEGNGPRRALEHYRNGDQDLASVARSVMNYKGCANDDPEPWRAAVAQAIASLPHIDVQASAEDYHSPMRFFGLAAGDRVPWRKAAEEALRDMEEDEA